jgi:NADH-quinone oxidoreductase subunit G
MTVRLTIDGVPVSVPKGTLLVEAAKTVKQEIPIYCYHTKLGPAGLCRVCLVDIEGMPKLQIACNTPVADGMVVRTRGERVEAGRAIILELLLVNHPLDCPICDKGGECDLQDYAMAYARGYSDVADSKLNKPKAVDLGPTIVLDEERCIVCQRCVRFDDIIAGERQLVVKDRGVRDIIATATGDPYRHNFTGNVTELCPVGALTSKIYRFKARPWDLRRTETTCTQCAVGCRQFADVRYGNVVRTMSVAEDDAVSDGWLCDRGRYNIGFYTSPDRVTQPLYRKNGTFVQIGWDDALLLWRDALTGALGTGGPASIGAVGGGRLTNEEAYVLQYLFRALGTRNVDWRAGRQRQATPGGRGGSVTALESARFIVAIGSAFEDRAPVLWLRARKAVREAGATIVRADSPQAARAAIDPQQPVALLWDGVDLELARAYGGALSDVAQLLTYVGSEQGNARGAEAMGMLPNFAAGYAATPEGLDTFGMLDEARAGNLRVLSLFGVNPARNAPDPDAAAQALEALPFCVVSDLFLTETARRATLVLPAAGSFEKSGTTTNFAGDVLPVRRALDAPDGVLTDLEMLVGLAEALDVALPTVEGVDDAVAAHAAAPAAVEFGDERFGGRSDGTPARENTAFSGGGTWEHDPTLSPLRDGRPVAAEA